MANVFISRNKHIEAGILSRSQQVAVAEPIPSPILRLYDCMASKKTCDSRRSQMVKENEHSPGAQ